MFVAGSVLHTNPELADIGDPRPTTDLERRLRSGDVGRNVFQGPRHIRPRSFGFAPHKPDGQAGGSESIQVEAAPETTAALGHTGIVGGVETTPFGESTEALSVAVEAAVQQQGPGPEALGYLTLVDAIDN
jgi:hypothetical protein